MFFFRKGNVEVLQATDIPNLTGSVNKVEVEESSVEIVLNGNLKSGNVLHAMTMFLIWMMM